MVAAMSRRPEVDKALRECEQLLASAITRRDITTLERLFAPRYVFTSAHGETWGRDRAMAEFTDPAFAAQSILVEVEDVASSGESYVVTGRSQVAAQIGLRDLSGTFHFSHTWRHSQNGWQLTAGRTSALPLGANMPPN